MYVIRRKGDGKFVARPGSKHSYTQFLQCAQTFSSWEFAKSRSCGNEYVMSVEDCIHG